MSGHSHAKNVQRVKEASAKKRSQIFSKLARQISLAARAGGDPQTNSALRLAIERAREFNMPNENIERAIKRGTGELEGENLESFLLDAYGPDNVALIIEGITDNKNRALSEIKQTLNQYGGKLVQEGAVRWMFERKGWIGINLKKQEKVKNKEELELLVIESGAENFAWEDDILEVYTKPEELDKVKKYLTEKGAVIDNASLDWVPKEKIDSPGKEKCEKLFDALDELDSVQDVYSNLKE